VLVNPHIQATPMNAKESAQHIINQLPEQASWNDIMYELYVKQKIEAGIIPADEGRTIPHEQVRTRIMARHQKNVLKLNGRSPPIGIY
jgi:predicted transcriptional regulator